MRLPSNAIIARFPPGSENAWLESPAIEAFQHDESLITGPARSTREHLRAWHTRSGLFVAIDGRAGTTANTWRVSGAELFVAPVDPGGHEGDWTTLVDGSILLSRGTRALARLPAFDAWRPLSELTEWRPLAATRHQGTPQRPSPPVRLVESREPESVAGVLFPARELDRIDRRLAHLSHDERAELRICRRSTVAWIFSPRGLPEDLRIPGRALRVLGNLSRCVLLPLDREPRPTFDGRTLLEIFDGEPGQSLLWWDTSEGERSTLFHRGELVLATRDELRSLLP